MIPGLASAKPRPLTTAQTAATPALVPARVLPDERDGVRLLTIDPDAPAGGCLAERRLLDLPALFRPGDLLVVNDAATVPASLTGVDGAGAPLELRLCGWLESAGGSAFQAVLFGAGDWRTRTEDRAPPPMLAAGDRLRFGALEASVRAVSALSPRLVELQFSLQGSALWQALYDRGRPVQYAHLQQPLPLWAVQNVYAGRPWSFEMPSAGRPLTWRLLQKLRQRGIGVQRLTHAAGLSATGDPALDAALPLPEWYELPAETVAAVLRTRRAGGRVVAVGTTVVRALEGVHARWGRLRPGRGRTALRLGPSSPLKVVNGLLSGLHAPGESHFELLSAFAPRELLTRAARLAGARGFRSHELGDLSLVLGGLQPLP